MRRASRSHASALPLHDAGRLIGFNKRTDGRWPLALLLTGITVWLFVVAGNLGEHDPGRISRLREKFLQACDDNSVDRKIGQRLFDAGLKTPKPYTINPCQKWAETVDEKLPPRSSAGLIHSTARLNPPGKGITGVYAGQAAWVFDPCPANLWCVFTSGHFAIYVRFPDGQQFWFDDGSWGRVFQSGDIPDYAR
jgi:hypothetical protein